MKSVYYLVLLAIILVTYSASPSVAAVQTDLLQTSTTRLASISMQNSTDTQLLTYLPSIFNNFLPTCQEIPERILTLFGPSLIAYYPLWETSGNTVVDLSPNNRFGVYEGYPALNTVPALCGNAPRFDGMDDVADVFSSGLASAFNGGEGTAIIQLKVEPEEWIDGKAAYYLALRADPNNKILFYKSARNQLEFSYTAGGTKLSATFNDIATNHWVTYAITWSKSNNRFHGYVAGESIYQAQIGLGVWGGKLTSAEIAGYLDTGSYFAKGSVSSVVLLDREASAEEIREYSASFGATKVLTVLGDSISRVYMSSPWSLQTVFEYDGGNHITLKSHAVSGQTIMDHLDAQTEAAKFDDADIIILELGTVDKNDGDMAALQAKVEENIAKLKLNNPRAKLYYMNVLPIWTDKSGKTEVDKSNIRAAIAAACSTQGITCWDTYSTPWITAADTFDGVHPTATGHTKIANQVLQRIELSTYGTIIEYPSEKMVDKASIEPTSIYTPEPTSTPTPHPFTALDLESALILPGDLPEGYIGGQVSDTLPEYIDRGNHISATYQIYQEYEQNNESAGGVTVMGFDDDVNAANAIFTIADDMGWTEEVENIGETMFLAENLPSSANVSGSTGAAFSGMDGYFRRCNAVVHIRMAGTVDRDSIASYAQKLDERLTQIICH